MPTPLAESQAIPLRTWAIYFPGRRKDIISEDADLSSLTSIAFLHTDEFVALAFRWLAVFRQNPAVLFGAIVHINCLRYQ